MKKIISAVIAVILVFSYFSFVSGAEEEENSIKISLRIEGVNETLYNKEVDVKYTTDTVTLKDALLLVDKQESELEMKGIEDGYINDINGEVAGSFGGYDGWMFAVNDVVASSGISDIVLKDGDKIVFYYADYPSQYTLIDSSRAKDGVIRFYSIEKEYGDKGEVIREYESPITDAPVVFNSADYITDEKGEINVGKKLANGDYTVSLSKDKTTDSGTLPVAVRLVDFKLTVSDKVEAPNFMLYTAVTVIVVLIIAAGAFLLIKNKKKKA